MSDTDLRAEGGTDGGRRLECCNAPLADASCRGIEPFGANCSALPFASAAVSRGKLGGVYYFGGGR